MLSSKSSTDRREIARKKVYKLGDDEVRYLSLIDTPNLKMWLCMYDMPNQVGHLCLRPEVDDKCLQCFFAPTTTLDNREAVVNRRAPTRMVLSILFLFLTVKINI